MAEYLNQLNNDTFTVPGNGVTQDVINKPIKYFVIQVTGTNAVATAWNVVLEGSLDNVNFTIITTHTNTSHANGEMVWPSGHATVDVIFTQE